MKKIVVLVQLLFVTLTTTEPQRSSDAVITWPFYLLPAPLRNSSSLSNDLLRGPSINRRDGYVYVAGIGSYKLHVRAVPWNDARLTCEEEGGHLAIINSIAEANAVAEILNHTIAIPASIYPDMAHIGFHDLYQEGQFVTIHGQSLAKAGYSRFAIGQPDNLNGREHCGSIYRNGGLNDILCQGKLGFICELPIP